MKKATLAKNLYHKLESLPHVAVGARFTVSELLGGRAFVTPVELWCENPRVKRALCAHGVPSQELSRASDYERLGELLDTARGAVGSTLLADLASDLAAITGDASLIGRDVDEIWRGAFTCLAKNGLTPGTLLSQHRAALVNIPLEEWCGVSRLGGDLLPLPALDASVCAHHPQFQQSVAALSDATGMPVADLKGFEAALCKLLGEFAAAGAPAACIDLSHLAVFERPDPYHAGQIFETALAGRGAALSSSDRALFSAQILRTLGRAMRALKLRLVVRVCPKTEHVWGRFSAAAFEKLLAYLDEREALVPTLLSLRAGEIPAGLVRLLGRFADAAGKPRLYFGIEGAGAGSAELTRSLRYYLRHGAAPLLLGLTDDERGFFTTPVRNRFCRVLATELADFAARDAITPEGDALFSEQDLVLAASDILFGNASAFFGIE